MKQVQNNPTDDSKLLAAKVRKLAHNIWWTWNPHAQEFFKQLAPRSWRISGHNAVAVINTMSEHELDTLMAGPEMRPKAERIINEFEKYLGDESTWGAKNAPEFKNAPVAYFSAEFGLHESLPIYSGGLGILSGDHMKSISDLGIPCVGIGLFYRHGYFTQQMDENGWQQELYPTLDPHNLPVEQVRDAMGLPVTCKVRIGFTDVTVGAYCVQVGRISLYLLDTNFPENEEHWREVTGRVYGGDQMTRIGQELILGVGGIRMMRALNISPSVYHLNEGHSGFLILELLRIAREGGLTLDQARDRVRQQVIFTTHTPVAAGHDRFSSELMHQMLNSWPEKLGLDFDKFVSLGRVEEEDTTEPFCMTVFALRHCRAANAVSELNGEVSREMWQDLFKQDSMRKTPPIGHITNGVHVLGWSNRITYQFWEAVQGPEWVKHLRDTAFWEKVLDEDFLPDDALWELRYRLKRQLIEKIRDRIVNLRRTELQEHPLSHEKLLNPDALTLGFSRRFATYKRAPLIFHDMERVAKIFNNSARPVQIVFSGKAHPRDDAGKELIQKIYHISRDPRFLGKVFFIEGYDIQLARLILSGIDVLVNNPRRPLEASGTSGQKITIHGGLNFSVMDGWWREGFDGKNGFPIGPDASADSPEKQDDIDAGYLYDMLENKMIPEFYERDSRGIPHLWLKRVRNAIATLIPKFNTDRMVCDYAEQYYKTRGD